MHLTGEDEHHAARRGEGGAVSSAGAVPRRTSLLWLEPSILQHPTWDFCTKTALFHFLRHLLTHFVL